MTLNILLATYRGACFLPYLLDSLLAQRDPAWRVFARDDGSADDTMDILRQYAAQDPRIVLVQDADGLLGAKGNFARLLTCFLSSGEQWFALCDQDDVWLPNKVGALRQALFGATEEGRAFLVYSDLSWIDSSGRVLAASHAASAGVRDCVRVAGTDALLHNLVPGCAMAGNRALAELALPLPECVRHHDWWLLLIAASLGSVRALPEVLVLYRQHETNAIGASSPLRRALYLLCRPALLWRQARRQYWASVVQAGALAERATGRPLNPGWQPALRRSLEGLGATSGWVRLYAALSSSACRPGLMRKVFGLLGALSAPPPHC